MRCRAWDDDGQPLEPGELGMVIGWEGDLVVVSFSEGRAAALSHADLRPISPRTGR